MSPGKQTDKNDAGFPTDRTCPLGSESLGDLEPFSRVVSGPREQAGKSAKLPQLKAALLGPPGSGKSDFIASLQHSLIVDPSDVVRRCAPQGMRAPLTSRASGAVPANQKRTETLAETNADRFYVELTQPVPAVELVIYESGGEQASQAYADSSLNSAWTEQARGAQLLILCVDTKESQRDFWRLALEQVVHDLAQRQEELETDESNAELRKILPTSRSTRGCAHCLPFKRVLFLLSRFDLLLETALESQNGYGFLKLITALEPRHLARALDPVPQLCSLLGTSTIGKVLHAMQEDAEIAVGAVSAKGMSLNLSRLHAKARGRPGGAADLAEWRPFGVKEALEFLITGQCTAPVVPLVKEDLWEKSFIRLP